MSDEFDKHSKGLDSPGDLHFDITPADGADLAIVPRAIYVGTGGTLTLIDKSGTSVQYNPDSNSYILMRAHRVMSTGTTATALIGVY